MIVLLLLALVMIPFLCYVFCYSPPAKKVGDEMFCDPMLEDMMYERNKNEKQRPRTGT